MFILSMKSSSITYPESHYTVTRECCVDIVDGNFCAAKLIDFFICWHDMKKNNLSRIKRESEITKQHSSDNCQDDSLLQHHTSEDLFAGLIREYTQENIASSILVLEQKGFISLHQNPNPHYKSDRIEHFLVCPSKIQIALNFWEQHRESAKSVNRSDTQNQNPTLPNVATTGFKVNSTKSVVNTNNTLPTIPIGTPGKKLDPYGPDRQDAPAVNWGIDRGLWQTKQELVQFRIALIAYLPLVPKFRWIHEPIPYVRQTIKKATEGNDEAQTLLIDFWHQYIPGDGIPLPKASWLSLDELNQQRYSHWINNDARWNWQRENIADWTNKVLNQPESKPCKEMWELWLIDRQADTERIARLAKEQQIRNLREKEINEFIPLTAEESAVVANRIQSLKNRYLQKESQKKAVALERSTKINALLGITE